jgi:hypothetical protein
MDAMIIISKYLHLSSTSAIVEMIAFIRSLAYC